MQTLGKISLISLMLLVLASCATLSPSFEEPDVKVNSFRTLPSDSASPTFEIGLNIMNPNDFALDVKGMSYTVHIKGNEVFSGVTNNIPKIEAYGSADVTLTGKADLFGGISLIFDLLSDKDSTNAIDYSLDVKISLGNVIFPIYVTKEGEFDLGHHSRAKKRT